MTKISVSVAIAAAALLFLVSVSAVPVSFSSCGSATDPFVATSLDVDPFPVVHGANTSIVISGSAGKQIAGGKFEIAVFFLGLQVYTDSKNFCDIVPCPIQQGPQAVHYHYQIPSYAPPTVSVTVQVKGVDLSNAELFCYKFDTKVAMEADE